MHTWDSYSKGTLTPWIVLLIDQSALTAVRHELLTLWLQRACVQWSCKGSLALTLGGFCPALEEVKCAHTHLHIDTRIPARRTSTPRQSPSGMHSHRTVSTCIQAGGRDVGRFFLLSASLPGSSPSLVTRWATSEDSILKHWPLFCDVSHKGMCSSAVFYITHILKLT